ncbi:MAG: 50S ribosomal protein L24 [Pseudomonadota bacterium]
MHKIKKGDTVIALCGKDKGKQGKVLRVLPAKNRAVVEGINTVKKHVKPNPQKNVTGGVVTQEASIDLANLALYNPISKKADKVRIRILEDGKRVRVFKSNDELVDI